MYVDSWFASALTDAGLQQTALARLLGVTEATVRQWSHGRRPLPEYYVEKMPVPLREIVAQRFITHHQEAIQLLLPLTGGKKK